jgi:serine/threonine protein kinase
MSAGTALPAGHMLDGRYRIEKVVGAGGMGRVYLAHDTRLANRAVAVKEMIVGEGLQEKKAVEDFAREARVLAPLSHPGIPNLIDYFAEGGRHYLVMEYISGGDLQGWLDKQGPKARVPEAQVLHWSRAILEVLAFLHSQEPPIIYRDLKPGNIMIDQDGRAMLIDFGIARFLPPGGRGTQIGSVGYAPPEQYLGKLEPRSDIYSLGATMHHLLTGRDPQLEPPFSFPTVRELAPEVSARTERAVMMALERDPDKRPQSASAMLALLPSDDVAQASTPAPSSRPAVRAQPSMPLPAPSGGSLALLKTAIFSRPKAIAAPAPAATQPDPAVSPTAKTSDLRSRLAVAVRPAPAAPGPSSAPQRPAAPMPPRPVPAARPLPSPRVEASLICKTETQRFVMRAAQAVIGRHTGPADRVDIDLGILSKGGERVSRRHAEIIKRGEEFFIRDLGSLNGTFIVGLGRLGRDQLYKLKDRDQVAFAGATFEFRKGDNR